MRTPLRAQRHAESDDEPTDDLRVWGEATFKTAQPLRQSPYCISDPFIADSRG